jgi:hypothetical protein
LEALGRNAIDIGKAADIGGTPRVVLDNVTADNPLIDVCDSLDFIDRGFLPDLGLGDVMLIDFLDKARIIPLRREYDTVFCFDTLEHVDDPFKWCEHLAYIARYGGTVYASTVFSFPYHPSPQDYWRFSPEAMALLFESAGIHLVEWGWEDKDKWSVYALGRVQ